MRIIENEYTLLVTEQENEYIRHKEDKINVYKEIALGNCDSVNNYESVIIEDIDKYIEDNTPSEEEV